MPAELVTITVKRDDVEGTLVDGVVVTAYDATGTTLETGGTTGDVEEGKVSLMLDGDSPEVRYQLRFFVRGGIVTNPQYIDVYSPVEESPSGTNTFDVTVHFPELPEATDPLLCRVSGVIRGIDGRPFRGCELTFLPCFNPFVAGVDAVLGERVVTRTDNLGYATVDLYRNAIYLVVYETREDTQREIAVPDRPSVELSHILFPVPAAVVFDPPGPYTLEPGEELVVVPVATSSDYRELPSFGTSDITYASSDPDVFTVGCTSDGLLLTGVAAGSAELTATRKDPTIVYVPSIEIHGTPVDVEVS